MPRLTVLDLYAGCGGLTKGFLDAGYVTVAGVEHDAAAAATYADNFGGDRVILGDVLALDPTDLPRSDVILASPPTLGFSIRPSDPTGMIWNGLLEHISELRPRAFVINAVPALGKTPMFRYILETFSTGRLSDYEITWDSVIYADYGVPLLRHRLIMLGSRVGEPVFPQSSHAKDASAGLPAWRTVRNAIEDLVNVPLREGLPDRARGGVMSGPFRGLELHSSPLVSTRSLQIYHAIPPEGDDRDVPEHLLRPATGIPHRPYRYGRLQWDKPAPGSYSAHQSAGRRRFLHPQWDADDPEARTNRPLTLLENARLQGFPDDYAWRGPRSEIAAQIARATPVEFARALAHSLRHILHPVEDRNTEREPRVPDEPRTLADLLDHETAGADQARRPVVAPSRMPTRRGHPVPPAGQHMYELPRGHTCCSRSRRGQAAHRR